MKTIFVLFVVSMGILETQYQFLKIENSQVIFEKTYEIDSTGSAEIEKLLLANLPKFKDVSILTKTNDIITAKINSTLIAYKKYGGKWGTTALQLNHPFFADVSIIWKDNKYKVMVTNMRFESSSLGIAKVTDLLTNDEETQFSERPICTKAGTYIEKHLADLFKVDKNANKW